MVYTNLCVMLRRCSVCSVSGCEKVDYQMQKVIVEKDVKRQ